MSRKIILFELNEVPKRVLDDFVALRPKSTLATILPRMRTYMTHAEDTALSPWITWPTLHRGVSDEQHTISDFGQDLGEINAAYPSIWEILSRNGIRTGVCGSLHTYPLVENLDDYDFFIPDVFASGSECFPKKVESFQEFNLAMSRKSARNVSASVPWAGALRFLAAAPGLGLRPQTALEVGLQLLDERRRNWTKVRRRTMQVTLAFDIFMQQLQRTRTSFATFFTNHVASSMHRYWAARYPGDYQEFGCSSEWVDTFCHEIEWTMHKADQMVGRLVRFVDAHPEYQLWVASSMGQEATQASEAKTQVYLNDVGVFMSALGFEPDDWERRPAMLPRILLRIDPDKAGHFEEMLAAIQLAGRGSLSWKRLDHSVYRIHPGLIQNLEPQDEFCVFKGEVVPFSKLGFANVPIEDAAGMTAYHVPKGLLLVYDPRQAPARREFTEISTRDVAPAILSQFGVRPPDYMATPIVL